MAKKKTQKKSPTGTNAYSDPPGSTIVPNKGPLGWTIDDSGVASFGPVDSFLGSTRGMPLREILEGITLREIRRKDPEPPVYFPLPKDGVKQDRVVLANHGVEIYKVGGEFLFIPWASVIDMNGTYKEP